MSARWNGVDQDAQRWLTPEAHQAHLDNIAQGEPGKMIFKCPHCGSTSLIRTSRALSPLVKEVYYRCNDFVCGHTFKVVAEAVETISPPSVPNPAIAAALDKRSRPAPAVAPPTVQEQRHMKRLEHIAHVEQTRQRHGLGLPKPRESDT